MTAVFAIPGDKDRRTGGFIYEARVLDELNALGCTTMHMVLPDSFPVPTDADMRATLAMLRAVDPRQVIILDGLVFGALDPAGLATVQAPVIAMLHHPLGLETGIDPALASHLLRNEAACLRHAAHIVVPSPHTAKILIDDFGADQSKISIALPGFDRPIRHSKPIGPPLIVSIGLLTQRKGHDVLLSALAQIQDIPWQAEIIGKRHDTAVADALIAQNKALSLTDRVTFTGEMNTETMQGRLNAASIFALATRYEGYGMVLSEAMIFGLPIVSCVTGAVPDTMGDAGILVPVDDASAFADALRHLLTNESARIAFADAAHARSKTLPNWSDTAQVMMSAIQRVQTTN
ncbi:MAG: glycosyltransferase family 4 protein [Paracoccaceae bacterium]